MKAWLLLVLAVQAQASTPWNPDGKGWVKARGELAALSATWEYPFWIGPPEKSEWRDHRLELELAAPLHPRLSFRGSWRTVAVLERNVIDGWNFERDAVTTDEALSVGLAYHQAIIPELESIVPARFNPDGRVMSPYMALDYLSRQASYRVDRRLRYSREDDALRVTLTFPVFQPLTFWASYEGAFDPDPLPKYVGADDSYWVLLWDEYRAGLRFFILADPSKGPWIARSGPAGSWCIELSGMFRGRQSNYGSHVSADLGLSRVWANGVTAGLGYRSSYSGLGFSTDRLTHGLKASVSWAFASPGPPADPETP